MEEAAVPLHRPQHVGIPQFCGGRFSAPLRGVIRGALYEYVGVEWGGAPISLTTEPGV